MRCRYCESSMLEGFLTNYVCEECQEKLRLDPHYYDEGLKRKWVTPAGHNAIIYRFTYDSGNFYHTHLCGYLEIPAEHKLFEVDYNLIDIGDVKVPGGITFAGHIKDGESWHIGFDCAHGWMTEKEFNVPTVSKYLEHMSANLEQFSVLQVDEKTEANSLGGDNEPTEA